MPHGFNSINGLSDKELERSYWILTHKLLIKKIAYSFLIILDLFLLFFSSIKLIRYYTVEDKQFNLEMNKLYAPIAHPTFSSLKDYKNLELGQIKVISNGREENLYDLAVEVYNPNEKFIANFSYQFTDNNVVLNKFFAYVLPKQRNFITAFNVHLQNTSSVNLNLGDINFSRIPAKKIPDPIKFINERLIFGIENIKTIPVRLEEDFYKTSFDLINKSAYSYWEAGLQVVLYRNDEIIGINYILIEKLISGERRPIDLNWYNNYMPASVKVEVIPIIDLFNPQSYMKLNGSQKGLIPLVPVR